MLRPAHFTLEVLATCDQYDLYLAVAPDTDFDSTFEAYDTDTGEILRVNGWLFTIEELRDAH